MQLTAQNIDQVLMVNTGLHAWPKSEGNEETKLPVISISKWQRTAALLSMLGGDWSTLLGPSRWQRWNDFCHAIWQWLLALTSDTSEHNIHLLNFLPKGWTYAKSFHCRDSGELSSIQKGGFLKKVLLQSKYSKEGNVTFYAIFNSFCSVNSQVWNE